MFQKRSKSRTAPAPRVDPVVPAFLLRALLALGFFCSGCGDSSPLELPSVESAALQPDRFSVMSYNLGGYGISDRDGDGLAAEPKPDAEYRDTLSVLTETYPDIVALQGMGSRETFDAFQRKLAEEGVPYPHAVLLQIDDARDNLALLSRHPVVLHQFRTNDTYRIGETLCPVTRGILDATFVIYSRCLLRLYVAHPVDKVFHPLGQAEMRRNEARILAQYVGRAMKDQPGLYLLAACSLGDIRDSAPFRELTEKRADLVGLDPRDNTGDAWTFQDPDGKTYHAHDFLFASHPLTQQLVPEESHVVNLPKTRSASPHRPILATFRLPR